MDSLLHERVWMYNMRVPGESYNNDDFMAGVRTFIETAISRGQLSENNFLRCACSKCKNKKFLPYFLVEEHLYKFGFLPNYFNWTLHGEDLASRTYVEPNADISYSPTTSNYANETENYECCTSRFPDMVADLVGPSCIPNNPGGDAEMPINHENPNLEANRFYNLLQTSSEPAYDGCTTETQLSINMKLLATKANHGFSEGAFNSICDTMHSLVGGQNRIPTSFRESKRLVSELGMGYQRIDVCISGCMIYYGEDESRLQCRFCSQPRYNPPRRVESSSNYKRNARSQMFYLPIIPRLQRLFLTENLASQMSWHAGPRDDVNRMIHPSDGHSWKHFDLSYPKFDADSRNVRIGLCSDGFSPWGMSSKQYSCWPVMITPYNFPPWMCMKPRHMWLTVLIPGPSNPKKRLDIYLRPLMDDLLRLWTNGVETFDAFRKKHFVMRAALMWTIFDFPAYGMLSGWSTQEQQLDEEFDGYGVDHNWTKKSIFWELPYWPNVQLRHNLDVMHIEKNVFENLFNTIIDVKGKTKDNGVNCKKDIAAYCIRPELELKSVRGRIVGKKAKYQLTTEQQY
ncbi:hypothetical protein QQ045_003219 [Rhodiola kirilowii]